jgi:Flp pilus assembly pilin Flp
MFATFLENEDGAITVDWTVLTGTLVGLALAGMAVVSNGMEDLSTDVSDTLSAIMTDMLYSNGFQMGAAGWLNGVVSNDAFGAVLGPYGGTGGAETVQSTFNIPEGTEVATFTFDMLAIDSWDNEELIVFVDGEPAASLSFQHSIDGVTGQWVSDNPNYTFQVTGTGPREHGGYDAGWTDQVASVQLEIANPGDTVTLGFGSTLNQEIGDESFAIDNVTLSAN